MTFYRSRDAIAALASEISVSGDRLLTISIPRVNHKTQQAAVINQVEKKPRQEFARPAIRARNVPPKELLPKVTLFLDVCILLYMHVLSCFFPA